LSVPFVNELPSSLFSLQIPDEYNSWNIGDDLKHPTER